MTYFALSVESTNIVGHELAGTENKFIGSLVFYTSLFICQPLDFGLLALGHQLRPEINYFCCATDTEATFAI
jgi:hypothetical protein